MTEVVLRRLLNNLPDTLTLTGYQKNIPGSRILCRPVPLPYDRIGEYESFVRLGMISMAQKYAQTLSPTPNSVVVVFSERVAMPGSVRWLDILFIPDPKAQGALPLLTNFGCVEVRT